MNYDLNEMIDGFAKLADEQSSIQEMFNKSEDKLYKALDFVKQYKEKLFKALSEQNVGNKVRLLQELNVQSGFLPDDISANVSSYLTGLISQLRY
jgi:hypothetical protein